MLEENTSDETVSSAMLQYYEQINTILKACLEPNQFKYENPGYDPVHLYKNKATLSRELPSQSKSMSSNLRMGNTIVAEVHIEQYKRKDGQGYDNFLSIVFKRQ